MRQLVARIDDDLHRRLKERAAREGRQLNDLVTEVLAAAVDDEAASFRRRLDRSGLRALPPASPVPGPRVDPDRENSELTRLEVASAVHAAVRSGGLRRAGGILRRADRDWGIDGRQAGAAKAMGLRVL